MHWLSLAVVVLLCAVGAVAAYSPGVKDRPWFPLLTAGLSVCGGLVYGLAVRGCRAAGEVFALSAAWDAVAAAVYVLVPAVWFGLRLPAGGWAGMGLVAAGVLLLKVSAK